MSEYLLLIFILFCYMNLWFIISLYFHRNDVADIAWGIGFIFLAWSSFIIFNPVSLRSIGVNLLVTIWGLRLAWHIFRRNRKKKEDYRYFEWRKQWGRWFLYRSYFQIYLLQGFLLFLVVLPVIHINRTSFTTLTYLDFLGLIVWIIGFFFEAVGDYQLAVFVKDPANKGKIMKNGLWRYSRHPNYFGEVTLWWGIFIIALGLPNGFYTIIGPLTITILILFVSGIALLERKYAGMADFEEYKKSTSVFFPLPPKII